MKALTRLPSRTSSSSVPSRTSVAEVSWRFQIISIAESINFIQNSTPELLNVLGIRAKMCHTEGNSGVGKMRALHFGEID